MCAMKPSKDSLQETTPNIYVRLCISTPWRGPQTTVYFEIEQDLCVQSWSWGEFVLIVEHAIRAWGIIMGHHHGAFIQIHGASSSGA